HRTDGCHGGGGRSPGRRAPGERLWAEQRLRRVRSDLPRGGHGLGRDRGRSPLALASAGPRGLGLVPGLDPGGAGRVGPVAGCRGGLSGLRVTRFDVAPSEAPAQTIDDVGGGVTEPGIDKTKCLVDSWHVYYPTISLPAAYRSFWS